MCQISSNLNLSSVEEVADRSKSGRSACMVLVKCDTGVVTFNLLRELAIASAVNLTRFQHCNQTSVFASCSQPVRGQDMCRKHEPFCAGRLTLECVDWMRGFTIPRIML